MKDTQIEGSAFLAQSVVLLEFFEGKGELVKEFDMIKNCNECKMNCENVRRRNIGLNFYES